MCAAQAKVCAAQAKQAQAKQAQAKQAKAEACAAKAKVCAAQAKVCAAQGKAWAFAAKAEVCVQQQTQPTRAKPKRRNRALHLLCVATMCSRGLSIVLSLIKAPSPYG